MRLSHRRVEDLIFDVFLVWALAGGAFLFGHYGWAAFFGSAALIESVIKARRYVRRRRGSDWYEH